MAANVCYRTNKLGCGVPAGGPMQDETKQRWEQLCEQAAVEQDPEKFFELIREINRLLEERRTGLENNKPVNAVG